MWRLVREGVRAYTPTLLSSWAFGTGVFILVLTILAVVGSAHDRSALLGMAVQIPLPILIASMVAAFIVTASERGEARVRLHVMLPVPLREVAAARVILPAVLMFLGLAVAHALFAVMLGVEGSPVLSVRHLNVDFMGLQLLVWVQLALVIREVVELKKRGSRVSVVVAAPLIAAALAVVAWLLVGPAHSVTLGIAVVAVLDLALMGFSGALFVRRTQFTK
jgi:hypothetical protein